jgi:hypothetical protein
LAGKSAAIAAPVVVAPCSNVVKESATAAEKEKSSRKIRGILAVFKEQYR